MFEMFADKTKDENAEQYYRSSIMFEKVEKRKQDKFNILIYNIWY